MRDVRQGNLNIELPVGSTDEVGRLTDSFNFFVKELRSKERLKQTFGKVHRPADTRARARATWRGGSSWWATRNDRAIRGPGRIHRLVGTADSFGYGDVAQPTLWFAGSRGAGAPRGRQQVHRGFRYGVLGSAFREARGSRRAGRVALRKRNWLR